MPYFESFINTNCIKILVALIVQNKFDNSFITVLKMKFKNIEIPDQLDETTIAFIHSKIIEQIAELEKLDTQFKAKQEQHFLKMFMNVLERIGNDLILAQEAYRNIDLEAKREKYYLQIADELNFFKNECFELKKENTKLKEKLQQSKLDYQFSQNEVKSLKICYEKKCIENNKLKENNTGLKQKLKEYIAKQKARTVAPEIQLEFNDTYLTAQKDQKRSQFAERWIQTQQRNRKRGPAQSAEPPEVLRKESLDQKGNTRYTASPSTKFRSTHNSSFRNRSVDRRSRLSQYGSELKQ